MWMVVCDVYVHVSWVGVVGVGGTMPKYITPTLSHSQMYSLHNIHPYHYSHTTHI